MIFDALDEEKDGEIELHELKEQMIEKFEIIWEDKEYDRVIKNCDLDGDGKMQFTEFVIAACHKKPLLSENNLKLCFEFIDFDSDGLITRPDLRNFLGVEVDDIFINEMLDRQDQEGDGSIDQTEFSVIMLKILRAAEKGGGASAL